MDDRDRPLSWTVVAAPAPIRALTVASSSVGLALVAALLNAVFAFCLGCEVYLLVRRITA